MKKIKCYVHFFFFFGSTSVFSSHIIDWDMAMLCDQLMRRFEDMHYQQKLGPLQKYGSFLLSN